MADVERPDRLPTHPPMPWRRVMVSRTRDEAHRSSTPLELLFDLCFVVAVAGAGASWHHAIAEGHLTEGLVSYLSVFFTIWWAWMNFSWFASAYDPDDVPYRIAVLVQILGALVLAAGVPRAFAEADFVVVTVGYTIMRVGLVSNWVRASRSDPATTHTARRYAIGVSLCQLVWITLAFVPALFPYLFLPMIVAEVSVPVWAERAEGSPWHPHHIAERYGLFTLIVLGETVLAASGAFQVVFDGRAADLELYATALGGLLIVFGIWWIYFAKPAGPILAATGAPFLWGYGHYIVFASAAAIGSGLAATIDVIAGDSHVSPRIAAGVVTVSVVLLVLVLWALQVRPYRHRGARAFPYAITAVLVLVSTALGTAAIAVTGLLLVGLVAVVMHRAQQRAPAPASIDRGAG